MKKVWTIGSILTSILVGTAAPVALAAPAVAVATIPVQVEVDGKKVATPAGMDVIDGQVMVPLRWAAELAGARSVQWDASKRDVRIEAPESYERFSQLRSYIRLGAAPAEWGTYLCQLPDRMNAIPRPKLSDRALVLDLEIDKIQQMEQENKSLPLRREVISITMQYAGQDHPYAVYSAKFVQGRVYVPMDWLNQLFGADVTYDKERGVLAIQFPNLQETKRQIAEIEAGLVPASPDETIALWGRGLQTRTGTLLYAALSNELRDRARVDLQARNWVTGGSSPHAGKITVQDKKQLDADTWEYTLIYPEVTSGYMANYPNVTPADIVGTCTDKLVVKKQRTGETEGWFIAEVKQSNEYYGPVFAEKRKE
ncbi:stalk domain-containing protein [Aneurinibacillus uraniidurans]|uniref:stalk domain-containing protein n=1 Tax=Aneurinibacillus uraniidurans TaxID=2966586 RepID=UPI002349C0FE|nr:stalk domain-containing protein [Aneurinibacillus sp. B1]WCN38401.1 stalk domain-containing protein [Aneurinibacillus sp. B1]